MIMMMIMFVILGTQLKGRRRGVYKSVEPPPQKINKKKIKK